MKFSILIANYNNGKYFEDCYNSIISQTFGDWEVIIVDDCSTDNSVEKIMQLVKEDKRFTIVQNEKNYGCGYTKRRCVEIANGDFACFLDPDDSLTPEALELMNKAHEDHPDVSLVHSSFFYCNELMERTGVFELAKRVEVNDQFLNLDFSVTALSAFKLAFYKSTQGIDPTLQRAVDQDLYLKLSETGPFFFIDKPLYNYRIHSKGISSSKPNNAFYWFLKVIIKTEERRKVNLENVAGEFLNKTSPHNQGINLANPRFLILAMIKAFKKSPSRFLRKLITNS